MSKDRPYGDNIKKLIADGKYLPVTGHGGANCSIILLDTEANVHVFCNKDLLTNLRPIDTNGDTSVYIEEIVHGGEIHQRTESRGYTRWVIHGTVIIHG